MFDLFEGGKGFEPRCTKKGPIKCDFGLWIAVEDPQTSSDHARPIQPIHITNINFGRKDPVLHHILFWAWPYPIDPLFFFAGQFVSPCATANDPVRGPSSAQPPSKGTPPGQLVSLWLNGQKFQTKGDSTGVLPYAIFRCILDVNRFSL